jgi:hypothetical protein
MINRAGDVCHVSVRNERNLERWAKQQQRSQMLAMSRGFCPQTLPGSRCQSAAFRPFYVPQGVRQWRMHSSHAGPGPSAATRGCLGGYRDCQCRL